MHIKQRVIINSNESSFESSNKFNQTIKHVYSTNNKRLFSLGQTAGDFTHKIESFIRYFVFYLYSIIIIMNYVQLREREREREKRC